MPSTVASEEHRPGADAFGMDGIGEHRPAKAVIVLGVQVGGDIDARRPRLRP